MRSRVSGVVQLVALILLALLVLVPLLWLVSTSLKAVSYTHLTLPTTPYV